MRRRDRRGPLARQLRMIGDKIRKEQAKELRKQTTVGEQFSATGVGLHSASPVKVTVRPAPAYTGYLFRRTDLNDFEIPASPEYVSHVSYATTLMKSGVMISTVEHLLSALLGCGVDNAIIDVDSLEVPILDGSSREWVSLIEGVGIVELEAPRAYLRVRKRIEVSEKNRTMSIEPADEFRITCEIDFNHPMIGLQQREIMDRALILAFGEADLDLVVKVQVPSPLADAHQRLHALAQFFLFTERLQNAARRFRRAGADDQRPVRIFAGVDFADDGAVLVDQVKDALHLPDGGGLALANGYADRIGQQPGHRRRPDPAEAFDPRLGVVERQLKDRLSEDRAKRVGDLVMRRLMRAAQQYAIDPKAGGDRDARRRAIGRAADHREVAARPQP